MGLDDHTEAVHELTSDVQPPLSIHQVIQKRRRRTIDLKHKQETVRRLQGWYDTYDGNLEGNIGLDIFENYITQNVERIFTEVMCEGRRQRCKKCVICKDRRYYKDEAVKRVNKACREVKQAHLDYPTGANLSILQRMAEQAVRIKQGAEEKDRDSFIQGINPETPVEEIFRGVLF